MEPRTRGSNKGSFERHNRAMRLKRYRDVCRGMPASQYSDPRKQAKQRLARKQLAWGWVQLTNRRQYSRIVWPWQARPLDPKSNPAARVKRGRASNPTAIR